jgi:hypothetical protein
MEEVVSQELVAGMTGLDDPEKRRARQLVRRGEVADDVVVARYAVAFARERARRFERSSFRLGLALGAAIGLAGIVFAVYLFKRSEVVQAVAVTGFGTFLLINAWRSQEAIIDARQARTAARLPLDLRGRRLISMLASRALAIEMMSGSSGRACSAVNRRLILAGLRPTRRASSAFDIPASARISSSERITASICSISLRARSYSARVSSSASQPWRRFP